MGLDSAAFQQLRSNRLAYVEGLRRNKGFEAGILRLLTQLYPDNAHFIYELLQNAEDAQASHARFTLSQQALVFEHDGSRLFSARDVESITSIGDSTKADSPTEIGKFGVGFKAVFAYTQAPEIYSGEYCFRIRDLVVPELLQSTSLSAHGFTTKFVFPFDHPRKSGRQATSEIAEALQTLDDATLLFLSNIGRVSYLLPDASEGHLERVLTSDLQHAGSKGEHIEVNVQSPVGEARRSHWLRYKKSVTVVEDSTPKECTVAVAFGLELSEGQRHRSRFRLIPLQPGRVCIYFPASKETSNLRFHLHAPFASTVARDSVRECPGNDQLLASLADLAAESMEDIRDRDLLSVAALEALPIDDDNLSPFYAPIKERISKAFKTKHLVPTKSGSHRPARELVRGPSDIVNLFGDDDLAIVSGNKGVSRLWCANPPQVNQRADRFLESIGIEAWGWRELRRALQCDRWFLASIGDPTRPKRLESWLDAKDGAWLRRFYALLYDATTRQGEYLDVSDVALVRVDGPTGPCMVKPAEAFFPPPDGPLTSDSVLLVMPDTYSSGRSESQKVAARTFLENAGVRVFDQEAELAMLLDLYGGETEPDPKTHLSHIKRFVAFYRAFPLKTDIFKGKKVFLGQQVGSDDEKRYCSEYELYLDSPFEDTGLSSVAEMMSMRTLWIGYEKVTAKKTFVEFVKALGIQSRLRIARTTTLDNPARKTLRSDYLRWGVRLTASSIDVDWTIKHIDTLVTEPTIETSRLLWSAWINASPEVSRARYRPNQQYPVRQADSQLIWWLKNHAWIPDAQGNFHKPQDSSRDNLPPDFLIDDRNGLLTAIGFEESVKQRTEEYQRKDRVLREVGFDGLEGTEEFLKALRESGLNLKDVEALIKRGSLKPEQPEKEVLDPVRRRRGILERRDNAPEKSTVQRERSIQANLSEVVAEARAYLRAKYTNSQGQMVCQACADEMPFKLSNGDYYFEAVQVLRNLDKQFYENRLALCPTCAAMYRVARSSTDEEIRAAIVEAGSKEGEARVEVPVVLADEHRLIRFVGTHFFDLRVVIEGK